MCCYIVQTVAMVMREGEHLLCHRVPDNSHETQTGCGATRRRFVAAVRRVVAVLVPLILMVPQGPHVLDGELGGGDRRGQAGQIPISLRQRLNRDTHY